MRFSILFVGALAASVYACKSQTVVTPATCSEPCCGGNPLLVNCGETPDISCTEKGDPCTSQAFGCRGGVFFQMPQASLPASCAATDGATDGTTPEPDATSGTFGTPDEGGPDAAIEGGPDAASDSAPDAVADVTIDGGEGGPEATTEAGPDATADGGP